MRFVKNKGAGDSPNEWIAEPRKVELKLSIPLFLLFSLTIETILFFHVNARLLVSKLGN
jgi:hypothetical protein